MLLRLCLFLILIVISPFGAVALESKSVSISPSQQQTFTHPYLYLTTDKINFILSRLTQKPYSKFWYVIKQKADEYSAEAAPSDISQLKDGPIRRYGDYIPFMAMAYLITGDEKYFNGTRRWMNALSSYKNWASNTDLGAAHLLFGMSIAYDWLYDKWTIQELTRYKTKISKQADILYQTLIKGKKWWARRDYLLQNHNYTNVMSIAIAGMALQNEESDANKWIASAEENFQHVLPLLSPDGASHEGIGYWGYGMESLLKYYLSSPKSNRIDVFKNTGYFRNATKFRLYASLPGYKDNVDYADSPRFDWYGPGYILRALASIFKDGHAQWLADRIEKARGINPYDSWLNLLWYDESVTPISPDKLPTFAYFDNMGIFIGRSSWADDATWVFFKAGASQGKLAESEGVYTGSHIHPDAGNFLLWAEGHWLVIDDGVVYKKRTENHNVLLFNNIGQLGEGEKWFDMKTAKQYAATSVFTYVDFKSNYQYLVAKIGKMYPPAAGVNTWSRSFVWLPPDNLIIHDDIIVKPKIHVTEKIHLSNIPKLLSPTVVCMPTDIDMGLIINTLASEGGSIEVGSYEIPKSEKTSYSNNFGGLVNILMRNNKTKTLLFKINKQGCDYDTHAASILNDVLSIDDVNTHVNIDFKSRNVVFGNGL